MPDMASPFNSLIAANQAPPQNPLAMANQAVQLQAGMAGAQKALSEADDAKLANAQNHINYVLNGLSTPLAKGPNVSMNDVLQAGKDLVYYSKGAVSGDEVAQKLGELPPAPNGDLNAPNPALYDALKQHVFGLMSAADRVATMRGQTGSANVGNRTQFYNVPGFGGAPQMVGSVANTMSPAEAATPTPGAVNKTTGASTSESLGERAEQAGLAPAGTYTGGGSAGGAQQVYIGPDGRITKRGPTMGSVGSGPIQTSLSPAQTAANKASGDAYASAQSNMSTYAQREQQLQSGLSALQSTNTGPGTESRNAIESYMLSLPGGLGRWIPGVDPQSVAAFDTANKYLTAAAAANPGAGRSDAGLSTAIASNPSVHISNAAAQDIQKANLGFIRFERANMQSFGGQDASQWQAHIAQRNASIDPHAYSADLISPAQRAAYMSSLSPSGKAKYLASIRDAMSNGAFTPADLQQGGAGGR